jgi:acyl-CoA synthetase (AMP-forming)/AMP-acid ligase II
MQREEDPITVFMGVPTMYSYLLSTYNAMPPEEQRRAKEASRRLRLTVSGSAPLPMPLMDRWETLSGVLVSWTHIRSLILGLKFFPPFFVTFCFTFCFFLGLL